jgi:hypothetical protein
MAVEILPLLEEEARKRQGHGLTAPGKTLREKILQWKKGKSRDQAAEIRLLAEAKLGELLETKLEHGGDRKSENQGNNGVTLKNIGITKMDSSRLIPCFCC